MSLMNISEDSGCWNYSWLQYTSCANQVTPLPWMTTHLIFIQFTQSSEFLWEDNSRLWCLWVLNISTKLHLSSPLKAGLWLCAHYKTAVRNHSVSSSALFFSLSGVFLWRVFDNELLHCACTAPAETGVRFSMKLQWYLNEIHHDH